MLKLLKKAYKKREVFGYLTFLLYICNMTYNWFISRVNERIKNGKILSKIVYDEEFDRMNSFPYSTILFIQTKQYGGERFIPEFSVLLDGKGKLAKEWIGGGLGTYHAVDIVDPSIEDYIRLSECLKRKRIRYNKKLNKIEKLCE